MRIPLQWQIVLITCAKYAKLSNQNLKTRTRTQEIDKNVPVLRLCVAFS